jgi:NAD(P)-dependent dehydrogenase (short-subunit alcohol dehydrogenase family)
MELELEKRRALVAGTPAGSAADTPDSVWSRQFESMFLSAVRLTRLALPGMRKRGFGRILASPRASYMTGGVIRVDGGMIRSV